MSSLHLPLLDWLNLLVRWAHIVAGIMWIGNSFLFVWLDSALHGTTRAREGDVVGEIWLVHSGGFYEVVKRRSLRPESSPGCRPSRSSGRRRRAPPRGWAPGS